jgi:hypothetical protein
LLAMIDNDDAYERAICGAFEIDRQQAGSYRRSKKKGGRLTASRFTRHFFTLCPTLATGQLEQRLL